MQAYGPDRELWTSQSGYGWVSRDGKRMTDREMESWLCGDGLDDCRDSALDVQGFSY